MGGGNNTGKNQASQALHQISGGISRNRHIHSNQNSYAQQQNSYNYPNTSNQQNNGLNISPNNSTGKQMKRNREGGGPSELSFSKQSTVPGVKTLFE